ncbi:MAG TPA: TonB family protein [Mucilaginibacter sp.]|nr:TonB family protein [Mucilaginibacter sp.]
MKRLFSLLACLFIVSVVYSQDTPVIYYLTNSGRLVSTKDSADYFVKVLPPDTSIDSKLFIVYEYYMNGDIRLVTNSKTNDKNLMFQGRFIAFFPNGKKSNIGTFADGNLTGHVISYFPNGKFYNSINYPLLGQVLYVDCRDSTGKVLAENGTGHWVEYSDDFKSVTKEGEIEKGKKAGDWIVNKQIDSLPAVVYTGEVYTDVDTVPSFQGGFENLYKFLSKTIRYPVSARMNDEHGTVTVAFIVEKDGSLSAIHIKRSVSKDLDAEAIRVMKLSPKWNPGIKDGKPVRVAFSMPLGFSLSE